MKQGTPQAGFFYGMAVMESELSTACRIVGLVFALRADTETGRIQVSLTTLAGWTGLGRSTVARALNTLEHGGLIRRSRPAKWAAIKEHQATAYTAMIPAGCATRKTYEASPATGLGQSQSGTGLVPETTKASPRAGHVTTGTTGGRALGERTARPPTPRTRTDYTPPDPGDRHAHEHRPTPAAPDHHFDPDPYTPDVCRCGFPRANSRHHDRKEEAA